MIAGKLSEVLSGKGYDAAAAYDGDEAIEGAFLRLLQLLISDLMLSSSNGIALATIMAGIEPS